MGSRYRAVAGYETQRLTDFMEDGIALDDFSSARGSAAEAYEYTPPSWKTRIKRWFAAPRPTSRSFRLLEKGSAEKQFPNNHISNNRYNPVTFLPFSILFQFKQFSNVYYLLVALSQLVPSLRIGYIFTYFGPLVFVLLLNVFNDLIEEIKVRKRDVAVNSTTYTVYDQLGQKLFKKSADLRVGDLVQLVKGERVPADVVLLHSSEPGGTIFLRTDQLDGETDWKIRSALACSQRLAGPSEIAQSHLIIQAEPPNNSLSTFNGSAHALQGQWQSDALTEPINAINVLWANTVIATGSAAGVVMYTGRDTRYAQNCSQPRKKIGRLDNEINTLTKLLCGFTALLAFVLVVVPGLNNLWYIYVIRFIILFSSIIPISLRINLDLAKAFYAREIFKTSSAEKEEIVAQSPEIAEEVGRIQFLFSDKTGTLTRNEMEMKKVHLGTVAYTRDTFSDMRHALTFMHKGSAGASTGRNKMQRGIDKCNDMLLALALCHNVSTIIEGDERQYQASSPDELAIINFCKEIGLELFHRDQNVIKVLHIPMQIVWTFHVLHIFPFSSETKRMGIVVRAENPVSLANASANIPASDSTPASTDANPIIFLSKGADVVMRLMVQTNDWLDEETTNMAREGLRTLVMGKRVIAPDVYARFKTELTEASLSTVDRDAKMQACCTKYLEVDLDLLGVTGVEDKLQEDVKDTLESLRNAGIRTWMLTGDKVETARCIAASTRMIPRNANVFLCENLDNHERGTQFLRQLEGHRDAALVIDGASLRFLMAYYLEPFIAAVITMANVVCCRCSPQQKADILLAVKAKTGHICAAIGDGGNDVSMIQAADAGIGIVGKEGKQASLAADFSVQNFKALKPLLLWHGRNSYKRSAKLCQFIMHRGLIISIMQAVFSAIFYFSPIALYQGFLIVGYTTVYTMAPVFSLILDYDISYETALTYPELYRDLCKGRTLSARIFCQWLFISVYQGSIIMMLALYLFKSEFLKIVSITFTALIMNELLMVALEIHLWHPLMLVAEIGTLVLYLVSLLCLPAYFDMEFIATFPFLWKVAVITATSTVPLWIIKIARRRIAPANYAKLN